MQDDSQILTIEISRDAVLTRLTARLEAATSRLEDIASSTQDSGASRTTNVHPTHSIIPTTHGTAVSPPLTPSPAPTTPPSIQDFDALLTNDVKSFDEMSSQLGGIVAETSSAFVRAFKAQRQVLLVATRSKRPEIPSPMYLEILKDLQHEQQTVINLKDNNRDNTLKNQMNMLEAGVSVTDWIKLDSTDLKPADFVGETLGGAQMYGNNILREKEKSQVEWVRAFNKVCGSLKSYIKQYHPDGLKWNDKGIDAEQALRQERSQTPQTNGAPVPAPRGGVVPLPPPPPPLPLPLLDAPPPPPQLGVPSQSASGRDMGAVFDQLNRGESVTSGLRKVDKSEMMHKTPSLRASAPVPTRTDSSSSRGKSPTPPLKNPKPEGMRTKKPPRKELEGSKWNIENCENETSPIVINAERHHSILISRCKATTVIVKGKANAISVDSCSRLDIVVDSLVSSIDVINTANFRMQVLDTLPSIQLDKVDVGTIFLSKLNKDGNNPELFTSKCTSINITLPPRSEQDDSVECPVPEQIKTSIVGGRLVNEIVKLEG